MVDWVDYSTSDISSNGYAFFDGSASEWRWTA